MTDSIENCKRCGNGRRHCICGVAGLDPDIEPCVYCKGTGEYENEFLDLCECPKGCVPVGRPSAASEDLAFWEEQERSARRLDELQSSVDNDLVTEFVHCWAETASSEAPMKGALLRIIERSRAYSSRPREARPSCVCDGGTELGDGHDPICPVDAWYRRRAGLAPRSTSDGASGARCSAQRQCTLEEGHPVDHDFVHRRNAQWPSEARTCTVVLDDGSPCGEPVLTPGVCYDHAVCDPGDPDEGPADPRELRQRTTEATPARGSDLLGYVIALMASLPEVVKRTKEYEDLAEQINATTPRVYPCTDYPHLTHTALGETIHVAHDRDKHAIERALEKSRQLGIEKARSETATSSAGVMITKKQAEHYALLTGRIEMAAAFLFTAESYIRNTAEDPHELEVAERIRQWLESPVSSQGYPGACGDVITDRNEEHQTSECLLIKGHPESHFDPRTETYWTDEFHYTGSPGKL